MAGRGLSMAAAMAATPRVRAAWRIALCVGEDEAAVQDGARALVVQAAGSADDGFRVLDVEAGQRDAALAHARARPLNGGRAVVRVRGVTDRHVKFLAEAAAVAGDALFVVEAAGLTARSAVVKHVAGLADGVVVACHRDGAAALASCGARLDPAVAREAAALAGAPEFASLPATLSLLVGPGGLVDGVALAACLPPDVGDASTEAVWAAAFRGDARASAMAARVLSDGVSAVSMLRLGLMHVHRLRGLQSGGGAWVPRAIEAVSRESARLWTPAALRRAGDWLSRAEWASKQGRQTPDLVVLALAGRIAAQPGISRAINPSS